MSSRAAEIVQKLGGTRPLAAALRLPVSTVQSWKRAGQIPARHQEAVLRAAVALRVALSPEAFFDPQVVKRARARTPPAKKQNHHRGHGEHGERSLRFAAQPQSARPFREPERIAASPQLSPSVSSVSSVVKPPEAA